MKSDKLSDLAANHGRMVFHTAYRVLGNVEAAEDVLQDVFLKLLKNRGRPSRSAAIEDWGAYLRVLATRRAIDLTRRKATLSLDREDGSVDLRLQDSGLQPDAALARRQKARELRIALRSLPPRDAELFVLRYFEDLSYAELARHLKLSQNQVGVLLHRARGRLRAVLETGSQSPETVVGKSNKTRAMEELT